MHPSEIIAPSILASHPKFSSLCDDLFLNKFASDGSTLPPTTPERQLFQQNLATLRLETAKRAILQWTLQRLGDETSLLASAALEPNLTSADRDLILSALDQENFTEMLQPLGERIALSLEEDTRALHTILGGNDSGVDTQITSTQEQITSLRQELTRSRTSIAEHLTEFNDLKDLVIETSVKLLEQSIHGSVERATRARASYLASVAEGMAKKLAVQNAQLITQHAEPLLARSKELEDEERKLKAKIRNAEEVLQQYEDLRGADARAREYVQVWREIEKVKREIGRLTGV